MMRIRLLLLCVCMGVLQLYAARLDEVRVYSSAMRRFIPAIVLSPQRMCDERFPTVYLLHGYSGNASTWLSVCPELMELSEHYGINIVCPDGANSWYWDSPLQDSMRYETFISSELVEYVDCHYPTIASRDARAITGLSMGGHGALWNAIRHPDVFGAAGSTSGGVDIRPFPGNWEMSAQLGSYESNKEVWDAHTVANLVDQIEPGSLALIIDCGYDDFFLPVNDAFHRSLLDRGIAHDYLTRPGEHNRAYWSNSILYQLLFFHRYFDGAKEWVD